MEQEWILSFSAILRELVIFNQDFYHFGKTLVIHDCRSCVDPCLKVHLKRRHHLVHLWHYLWSSGSWVRIHWPAQKLRTIGYSSILDNKPHVHSLLWPMMLSKEMISLFNCPTHLLHNCYHVFFNLNYWLDSYSKEYDLRNQVVMLIGLFFLLRCCCLQLLIVMNHDVL